MSYAIELSEEVLGQLNRQPESLHPGIIRALRRLAANPTRLSHRSAAAFHGQLAELPIDDTGIWLRITFLYSQDEQVISITRLQTEFGA